MSDSGGLYEALQQYLGAEHGMGVKYLGGFQGHRRKPFGNDHWRVRLDEDDLTVSIGKPPPLRLKPVFTVVRRELYSQLRHVTFCDLGAAGTRANLVALGLFGLFGLAARRSVMGLVIGYDDGEVCFEVAGTVADGRSAVAECHLAFPNSASVLRFGFEDSSPMADDPGVAEQLTQLAQLHSAGALTDDEFASAKARLLAK